MERPFMKIPNGTLLAMLPLMTPEGLEAVRKEARERLQDAEHEAMMAGQKLVAARALVEEIKSR